MKLTYLLGSAFLAALAVGGAPSAAQGVPGGDCVTCINVGPDQKCAEGTNGDHCIIFLQGGVWYCNWQGACGSGFSALDLRAAGTFAAHATLMRTDGLEVSRCGGFIVSHVRSTMSIGHSDVDMRSGLHPTPVVVPTEIRI